MAKRLVWTGAFAAILAFAYLACAYGGLAPWPRAVASLGQPGTPRSGYALVSGYYISLPFVANGNGLPQYAFGETTNPARTQAPSVRVVPSLAELRAYRVVVVIDLATGDGSEWNPYVIHTVGSVTTVVVAAFAAGLMLLALLFWLAGYVAGAFGPRKMTSEARRAAS